MGARVGVWGNCVIQTWQAALEEQDLIELEKALQAQHARFPNGVALVVLIESGVQMPTAEQRKELENFYTRNSPMLRAVAQIVEGTGMWAVMGRSVMGALRLVQRRPYPTRIFSDLTELTAWMEPHVENPGGPALRDGQAGLRATIDSLRGTPLRGAM